MPEKERARKKKIIVFFFRTKKRNETHRGKIIKLLYSRLYLNICALLLQEFSFFFFFFGTIRKYFISFTLPTNRNRRSFVLFIFFLFCLKSTTYNMIIAVSFSLWRLSSFYLCQNSHKRELTFWINFYAWTADNL